MVSNYKKFFKKFESLFKLVYRKFNSKLSNLIENNSTIIKNITLKLTFQTIWYIKFLFN